MSTNSKHTCVFVLFLHRNGHFQMSPC